MSSSEFGRRQRTGALVSVLFAVLILSSIVAGSFFSYWLSGLHAIPKAKLLNIAGIAYGLTGVLVLSEAIVRSEQVKQFMVAWVGAALLWVHTGLASGAVTGAIFASALGRPSAHAAYQFAFSVFAYFMLIGGVLDGTVTNPLTPRLRGVPERHQRLGLILLLTGLVLQLVAAILDF